MQTQRQMLEAARRGFPPDQFADLERAVKTYPKSEARKVAQVIVPLLARNRPGVIAFTSPPGSPPPKFECEVCHRRNLAQPTLMPDGRLRFVCGCSRRSWTRDGRHIWNLIFAARDAGVSTVLV